VRAVQAEMRDHVAEAVEFVAALDAGTLDATALGELLFGVVQVARTAGLDPEDELRQASRRFVERFESR